MEASRIVEWEAETFLVGGLGAVTVTGTHANGLLTSVTGTCDLAGRSIEVSAECRFPECGPAEVVSLLAGTSPGAGGKATDDELDNVRSLVEAALLEWWETPEAQAMISANAARERQAAEDGAQKRFTTLQARLVMCAERLAAGPGSADEAATLVREMAETHAATAHLLQEGLSGRRGI